MKILYITALWLCFITRISDSYGAPATQEVANFLTPEEIFIEGLDQLTREQNRELHHHQQQLGQKQLENNNNINANTNNNNNDDGESNEIEDVNSNTNGNSVISDRFERVATLLGAPEPDSVYNHRNSQFVNDESPQVPPQVQASGVFRNGMEVNVPSKSRNNYLQIQGKPYWAAGADSRPYGKPYGDMEYGIYGNGFAPPPQILDRIPIYRRPINYRKNRQLTSFREIKRSPLCLRRCFSQAMLHPIQCHSLC